MQRWDEIQLNNNITSTEGISGNVSAFYSGNKHEINGEIKSGKDGWGYESKSTR